MKCIDLWPSSWHNSCILTDNKRANNMISNYDCHGDESELEQEQRDIDELKYESHAEDYKYED